MPTYDNSDLQAAGSAFNKIVGENYKRSLKKSVQAPPNGLLFHYTTAEGLQGIVEEDEIWATSAYFLNDSAEITYGYSILKDVLDEWIARNPRSEMSLTLCLARDLRRGFGHDLLSQNIIEPIYLACFCEEDNLLSQWRTYGQQGGYSIGFRFPCVGTACGLKAEPNTYTGMCVKVEYDREQQFNRCYTILDALLPIFDNAEIARGIECVREHGVFGYQALRRIVAEILQEESLGFKDKAFDVEKEWRIIVRKRELSKQGTDDGGRTATPVHFRSLRGVLVPYVKLIPTDELLPISCVRSGPTLDKTTAGMAVRMLLNENCYCNAEVDGSNISVKF